jgi:hypothetical protein
MSRAYRIKVAETLQRVLRAKDGVSTQLEILEILPPEQMEKLLAEELVGRGYEPDGDVLKKTLEGGIRVIVDPKTGTVTVQAEDCAEVQLQGEKEGRVWDETSRRRAEQGLHEQLRDELAKRADEQEAELQNEVTQRLEKVLGELRRELDEAVNKVTGEALKIKAGQIGQIKEISEDPQSGSMTIVVEV